MAKKKISLIALYEGDASFDDKEVTYSKEERNAFIEQVRNYGSYGDVIRRSGDLKATVDEISNLVERATNITLKETDGWFDNVTVTRHNKQMADAVKVLQKEASEIMTKYQRLEAAYDDVGQILKRYYDA